MDSALIAGLMLGLFLGNTLIHHFLFDKPWAHAGLIGALAAVIAGIIMLIIGAIK